MSVADMSPRAKQAMLQIAEDYEMPGGAGCCEGRRAQEVMLLSASAARSLQ